MPVYTQSGSLKVSGDAAGNVEVRLTGSVVKTNAFYINFSGSAIQSITADSSGVTITAFSGSNSSQASSIRTFLWNANGINDYFTTTTSSSGFDISASFDGVRRVNSAATIDSAFGMLLEAGTAGSSSVEVYRRRTGTMTRMVSFNIPFSAGDYSITSGTLHTTDLEVGDLLYSQFTGIMTGGRDLSFEINAS